MNEPSTSHMVPPVAPVPPTPPVGTPTSNVSASMQTRTEHCREPLTRRLAWLAGAAAGFSVAGLAAICALLLLAGSLTTVAWFATSDDQYASCSEGSIAVIPLVGIISTDRIGLDVEGSYYTSSTYFVDAVEAAVASDVVSGIVIDINSPGGEVVPSMEMAQALEIAKQSKPVAAYVRSMGNSGAYIAAVATDRLFVNDLADVGSIGAILAYLDEVEKNKQDGYTYIEFKSAPFKSAGSPYRDLSEAEGAMFQEQVNDIHERIVDHVARLRGLPRARAAEFADGSTWLGFRAVELGLADEVGGIDDAMGYVAEKAGLEEYEVCRIPLEYEAASIL